MYFAAIAIATEKQANYVSHNHSKLSGYFKIEIGPTNNLLAGGHSGD